MQSNNIRNIAKEDPWLIEFLLEESKVDPRDKTICQIASDVLSTPELKELVEERYKAGKRFMGWTKDGSKGYTDISTGNIWIGNTNKGTESLTLGYECLNSQNAPEYVEIGKEAAEHETTPIERIIFANKVLAIEARAMYGKCVLATKMNKRDLIKDYYLNVYDKELPKHLKISKLKEVMKDSGVVHGGKEKAYDFYQNKRYDEIVNFYRRSH